MRRLVTPVILIAGFFGLPAEAATDWVPFTSPQFSFSAQFPDSPEQEASASDGVQITSFSAMKDNALCMVSYGLYASAGDASNDLVANRDAFFRGVEATMSTQSNRTVRRGSSALSALVADGASASYAFRTMIVVEGNVTYQVAGAIPNGGDVSNLEKCISGFTLPTS